MKKTSLLVLSVVIIVAMVVACAPKAVPEAPPAEIPAEKELVFATVVKSIAFGWFQRLEEGVIQFGKDYGVKAYMEGPTAADSAAQVAIIESLIAQGVDAIINVPYGVPENEPAQEKAMDAGIIVVGHEAATAKAGTLHYDVEAFDNCSYGEEMMKELATRMGEEGKYIQFTGSLTNATHMEWVVCAKAYQEKNYPKLELVGLYESKEDMEVIYDTMKDLLKTYPDIKGVQGSSAYDVVGAGQVFEEAGLAATTAVVGTSIPSYAGELLKTGAVDLAMAWDPAVAGYVSNVVAYKVLKGEAITDGMDLKAPGFEKIRLVTGVNGVPVIYGSAWIKIDAKNMDQYPF